MGHGGNVIAELTADHREVEELFAQIEGQPVGHSDRRQLVDQLISELVRHSVAEEMHLYPSVRRHVPDGDELADKEIADHGRIERMLKDLEERDAGDPEFNDLVAKLKFAVAAHVRAEESELFPELTASCSPEELNTLGQLVRRAKETVPTRPHHSMPDTPPANKVLAPGAGLVDRLRDLLSGRDSSS
ncbi:hemerythrin domain-containing protein [Streptomyces finlayi]|uniref:Hemerythrin domain-containing protein n=1 Tax=Streptomyces finlayi TaxID=67296 RepID=A0A7G7BTY2_9ACTN|nr:hemerythrin domain-containing protein [Streptomyces finlayi]QNE78797.1 hemerythrin domain-containing protein [Streptomyces finlayi]